MLYNAVVKAHSATEAVDAAFFHGIINVLDVSHVRDNEYVLVVTETTERDLNAWFGCGVGQPAPFPYGSLLYWNVRHVPPMARAAIDRAEKMRPIWENYSRVMKKYTP
jgi:hypothetical protein